MKRLCLVFVVFMFLSGASNLSASDWGCKCLICLSNPGGATEYGECRPPIQKLERHLSRGGSFPNCDEAKAEGYDVTKGYERYYTCKESYGVGWESAWKIVDVGGENTQYEKQEYCRKFEGYRIVQKCAGEYESGAQYGCKDVRVPAYSEKQLRGRSKPNFIELKSPDGQKLGKRVYYKKKRKKRGLF